ncbi:MAG: DUF4976 domain-containing protein [Planctomycetes bacterium]|nr:DUF4976 domain-containing protein [Planctomycetota bacterium]
MQLSSSTIQPSALLRLLGVILAIGMWLCGCVAEVSIQGADPRPNVLILLMDDQQADTIAALGNRVLKTPNLDRLVADGVSFDTAYMQGGFNPATCVPSRAMLLSGRPLFQIDERLTDDQTWPAKFGESSYETFVSGKWHNGEPSLIASFQRGKKIFSGGMTNPMRAPLSDIVDGKLTPTSVSATHACTAFADAAIDFLKQPRSQPFLCYVAFDGPHDPHVVPHEFPVHYDPEAVPLPKAFLPQHPWDNGEMSIRDEMLLARPRDPNATKRMIADYYRYVSFLDQEIGRILDTLAESNAAENTIVVFASDSGVALGRHGLVGKQNLYEHSLRVPLILSGPGIPRGKQSEALVYTYDIFPTLGRLCGVTGPDSSGGIDFSPAFRDPKWSHREFLIFAYKNVQRAIRDDRWKLIQYPLVGKNQLFDLKTDPEETNNLVDQSAYSDHVERLYQKLLKEIPETADRPRKPPSPPNRRGVRPPPPPRRS